MAASIGIEEARRLYGAADSVHDFDHILRVLALAERIARAEGADLAVVRTAALLHDWGRAEAEAAGRDHAEVAAERAAAYLQHEPPDFVAAVAQAIIAHRFRTGPGPATLEAQVLFDADKLDAIGAIGVARAFAYAGAYGQRLWVPLAEAQQAWVEGRHTAAQGNDPAVHTPVHEFVVKLARIKAQLYTRTGRAIAEERHRYMEEFYRRLDAEVLGEA